MDGKIGTFLLGVIAAVVLVMLWKKERSNEGSYAFPGVGSMPYMGASPASCGCGDISAPPSAWTSPSDQSMLVETGMEGQVSPGTPPLNAATGGHGATSFYTNTGVTPDTSFTFRPVTKLGNPSIGSPVQVPRGAYGNVPGSNTTPSNTTPIRATQQVPSYNESGFVAHYRSLGTGVN